MSEPDHLFCQLRKKLIIATPEEKIRQFIIQHLIHNLGYPQNLMILEAKIEQLPHLDESIKHSFPNRRLDLLVLAKDLIQNYPLYPLLLLEFKSTKLNAKTLRQVLGYNHFLNACFIAVANHEEILLGWFNPQTHSFHMANQLPPYQDLLQKAKENIKLISK